MRFDIAPVNIHWWQPVLYSGLVGMAAALAVKPLGVVEYQYAAGGVAAVIGQLWFGSLIFQVASQQEHNDKLALELQLRGERYERPKTPQIEAPLFLLGVDNWTGYRADFRFCTPVQTLELARRARDGNLSLTYNALRSVGGWPDERMDATITAFRNELLERGFAQSTGHREIMLTPDGEKHFREIARQLLPRPR